MGATEKNKYSSMNDIMQNKHDDVWVEVAWIGENKKECYCFTFNHKVTIYCDIENIENKSKVKVLQGDIITGGYWLDLTEEELQQAEIELEKLINK